jgi:ribosomal protein S18 acetylase RimI-like enzyme
VDTAAVRHAITTVTDPGHTAKLLDDIAPVYEEVYAEPPYHEGPRDVAQFIERYGREHKVKGFRLATARDERGDLSAFAYGLPLSSSTSWWDGFLDTTLTDDFTREDGRRTFVIMELAVRAPYRRQGVARALHAALMDGNAAERVTLAVRPEAEPANHLYAALGYELVGHTRPWDDAPTYACMIRDLNH